jgi:hypothetical protein
VAKNPFILIKKRVEIRVGLCYNKEKGEKYEK